MEGLFPCPLPEALGGWQWGLEGVMALSPRPVPEIGLALAAAVKGYQLHHRDAGR